MSEEYTSEIRDLRNGEWFWIHKGVIRHYTQKVGSTGITVYSFLASLVNGNQRCFPSQKYIARSLGYSRATISRTLKLLERNGLIRIEKRSRYHCVYELLRVRCKADETQMSHGRNSDVTPVNTNNNKLTINTNNINVVKNAPLNGSLINSLIGRFRAVNPNYERLFANKTQRAALERLVGKFGQPMVERLIDLLPRVFGRPYAPRITTPLKLEEKLADLLSFIKEEKQKTGRVFTIKSKPWG